MVATKIASAPSPNPANITLHSGGKLDPPAAILTCFHPPGRRPCDHRGGSVCGTHMIEISGLSKLFGNFSAVRDLSFRVGPGEVLGLVGPNGAGKTTTLRTLAGIIPPSSGGVFIGGHDLLEGSDQRQAAARLLSRRAPAVRLPHRPAAPHLRCAALWRAQSRGDLSTVAGRAGDCRPGRLGCLRNFPAGMKQKLAIACGLLHSPTRAHLRRAAHRARSARHPAHEGLHPAAGASRCGHRAELAPSAPAGRSVLRTCSS